MKGTANQIWLNEDLTKRREWLDYIALQLFKNKHIDKNWTFLGDIFIKKLQPSSRTKLTQRRILGHFHQPAASQERRSFGGRFCTNTCTKCSPNPDIQFSSTTDNIDTKLPNAEAGLWASQFTLISSTDKMSTWA